MKTKLSFTLAALIIFIGTSVMLTQQSNSQTTAFPANASPKAQGMTLFMVDDKTHSVVASNRGHSKEQLDILNSPDQLMLREKSALSLQNPAEFERLFPKSNADLARELEAAYAITHPAENYARVQRLKTREQIKQEDEAIMEIVSPSSASR